jgi:predicted lysophospholipase L1 biosynthesis ABC-type transport system permease subunit
VALYVSDCERKKKAREKHNNKREIIIVCYIVCRGVKDEKRERNSQRFAISNLRPSEKISSAVFFSLSFSIQMSVILFMMVGHTWRLRLHVDAMMN